MWKKRIWSASLGGWEDFRFWGQCDVMWKCLTQNGCSIHVVSISVVSSHTTPCPWHWLRRGEPGPRWRCSVSTSREGRSFSGDDWELLWRSGLQRHEGPKVWALVSGLTRVFSPSLEPDLGLVDLQTWKLLEDINLQALLRFRLEPGISGACLKLLAASRSDIASWA